MEPLKRLVGGGVPEGVDEDLRVEDVLRGPPSHRSGSGDVTSMPSMARVPSTSWRWNTARSSARSIASVAVAAPSARFATRNLESDKASPKGRRSASKTAEGRCEFAPPHAPLHHARTNSPKVVGRTIGRPSDRLRSPHLAPSSAA
jgi:hypothetical protein